MPWEEKGLKTMREEFVRRVLAKEKSKSALCREYGISRPTGDKWIERYIAGEELEDQPRAPVSPAHKTDPETEALIVAYRTTYPAIGAVKLRRMMQNDKIDKLPGKTTFNNIFKRNGLITAEASQAVTPHKHFEKSYPNEMLQADFKGHFEMKDGRRCHPLNIIDDYSRFNLCCKPLLGETFAEIKPIITDIFREYGLPFSFLCDNGNPWGVQSKGGGFTVFEVWLMELGVLTLHGRCLHPQTQGKEERFNGSLKRECLKYHEIADIEDAEKVLSDYRDFYNTRRPHHALKLEVPASKYYPSTRKYPERIVPWEYDSTYKIRHVSNHGFVRLRGHDYYLSEAFAHKTIAIRESSRGPNFVNIYFRQFQIAQLDLADKEYVFKRSYLIHGDPRRVDLH